MSAEKKLMILGASYSQIPLIEAAKRLGITTIAASIPGDYQGFRHADERVYVDISDPEAVVREAARLGIDGVATCGLDLGMAAIGAVCENMHLPGPSAEAARKASNKWNMKQALTEAGVQTARFFCIRSRKALEDALKNLPFPVILKAVDQMGSRGIFRCETVEEVYENYEKTMAATKKDYCLIEEFIEGEIFGVEAMIQDGQIVYMLPNNIEAFQSTTPTPIGHSVPFAELDILGAQIEEQTRKAIYAIGLDNCPVNCDFIKKDGKVYVVELTGRSGATGLSEMVSIYYGIDYYEMIVRVALGMPVKEYFAFGGPRTANLTHTLIYDRKGVIRKIHNENPPDDEILELSFNVAAGDEVRPYTNGRDRIGQVIIKGENLASCRKKLKRVISNIHLELEEDILLCRTPIQPVSEIGHNKIYIKREDLLPFSFGGNKVRFCQYFLEDMERGGYTGMVIYGNYHSNLCRIFSAACRRKGIPCNMVHNVEDADAPKDSPNARLIRAMEVKEFFCRKENIAEKVDEAMEDLRKRGYRPYYIYGDRFGKGNETVPMQAYVDVYREICSQEQELGIHFDYIFLASSTNTTHSGLLAGHLLAGDEREIVGISVSRTEKRAREVIGENLTFYMQKKGTQFPQDVDKTIRITDRYLEEGYGHRSEKVNETVREIYEKEGIYLDTVYTGKAFYGMREYLKENKIQEKNVLFLHTGGLPLFFEELPDICGDTEQ